MLPSINRGINKGKNTVTKNVYNAINNENSNLSSSYQKINNYKDKKNSNINNTKRQGDFILDALKNKLFKYRIIETNRLMNAYNYSKKSIIHRKSNSCVDINLNSKHKTTDINNIHEDQIIRPNIKEVKNFLDDDININISILKDNERNSKVIRNISTLNTDDRGNTNNSGNQKTYSNNETIKTTVKRKYSYTKLIISNEISIHLKRKKNKANKTYNFNNKENNEYSGTNKEDKFFKINHKLSTINSFSLNQMIEKSINNSKKLISHKINYSNSLNFNISINNNSINNNNNKANNKSFFNISNNNKYSFISQNNFSEHIDNKKQVMFNISDKEKQEYKQHLEFWELVYNNNTKDVVNKYSYKEINLLNYLLLTFLFHNNTDFYVIDLNEKISQKEFLNEVKKWKTIYKMVLLKWHPDKLSDKKTKMSNELFEYLVDLSSKVIKYSNDFMVKIVGYLKSKIKEQYIQYAINYNIINTLFLIGFFIKFKYSQEIISNNDKKEKQNTMERIL